MYGKRIAEGEIEISTASKSIANTGMDKGSAQIYLKCVQSMIQGERYTGTVKEMAVSYFLTAIKSDYGFDGLKKALGSLKMHLEYQSSYQNLPGMKRIYEKFDALLLEQNSTQSTCQ